MCTVCGQYAYTTKKGSATHDFHVSSLTSTSPIVIAPPAGALILWRNLNIVDLPTPDGPMMAVFLPADILKVKPWKTAADVDVLKGHFALVPLELLPALRHGRLRFHNAM